MSINMDDPNCPSFWNGLSLGILAGVVFGYVVFF